MILAFTGFDGFDMTHHGSGRREFRGCSAGIVSKSAHEMGSAPGHCLTNIAALI
jgi:hypothetical protein